MIDITLENFQSDVLDASQQQPVLLDIWAEWCGPCKSLGPVLERLEVEYEGRFKLAKVNADEQPEIAGQLSQAFGVRSIPFCVMFAGGAPVDGFVGALPAEQIRDFLSKHVPSEGELISADETAQAEALIEEGQTASALELLADALERDPTNDEARYDLIKMLAAEGAADAAFGVFQPIADRATGLLAEPRVAAFGLYVLACQDARQARPVDELQAAIAANKRDFETRMELARWLWAQQRPTEAMDELLEILMRDKAWADQAPRKTYVAILEVMSKPVPKPSPVAGGRPVPGAPGSAPRSADAQPKLEIAGKVDVQAADPVVDRYRRKLSMALN